MLKKKKKKSQFDFIPVSFLCHIYELRHTLSPQISILCTFLMFTGHVKPVALCVIVHPSTPLEDSITTIMALTY